MMAKISQDICQLCCSSRLCELPFGGLRSRILKLHCSVACDRVLPTDAPDLKRGVRSRSMCPTLFIYIFLVRITVTAGAPGNRGGASGVWCQPQLWLCLPSGQGHWDFSGAARGGAVWAGFLAATSPPGSLTLQQQLRMLLNYFVA